MKLVQDLRILFFDMYSERFERVRKKRNGEREKERKRDRHKDREKKRQT